MKRRNPRHGSMQFWPRVRAARIHARVRTWAERGKGLLGFGGYKAGMTHVIIADNQPTSVTKGMDVSIPVTVLECPPIKVAAIRFYKGSHPVTQIIAGKLEKELSRTIALPKKEAGTEASKYDGVKEYDDVRLIVYTQPKLTGIGKKKPEVFEICIGGSKEEKIAYAKEKVGKEIAVEEVFKEGSQLDLHAVTKGKGYQGPVKRFGITLKAHKSEKGVREPGSLGGWRGQGHVMYRVAHAGQMGYHQRTEYNKWLLKIGSKPEEINQKGGFLNYGMIKNTYLLVKGSAGGARKRFIKLSHAIRPNKMISKDAPSITYISRESKQ